VRPRLERDPGDAAQGGEGLAPEAKRGDAGQVLRGGQLAGGVAGEGQGQVLGQDTAAGVHDPDQLGAALLDLHVDEAGAGVHGVLQQLLDGARGSFDHLASSDLADDCVGELADAGHAKFGQARSGPGRRKAMREAILPPPSGLAREKAP
jgi:hypothetical protein